MVLKILHIDSGVQNFLSQLYSSNTEQRDGILIAGLGDDFKWYSNTAFSFSDFDSFLYEKKEFGERMCSYLFQNAGTKKIIPCLQYPREQHTGGLVEFVEENIPEQFEELIVPGVSFMFDYVTRNKENLEKGILGSLNIFGFDPIAIGNINELMDDFVNINASLKTTSGYTV